ncbi:uncharacterized protein LOC108032881 [Drosophila biarmipes]|uniref:uncharacterized protein LOC108032881 n=1 Tax=Drosophila biarmipes TaxID=125945 RepID=UPI0007E6D7A0|nr:uncharacterized protein LOC108032881 [Drosophila biarmipes]
MSSHQCSLGKLAQRGASLQMRCFYHTCGRPFVVQSMGQLNQWSRPAQAQPDNFERSRVRKIVGVKKTLVNQMQGMAHSLGPSKVAPYKIYGKTRLFSSSSNLHGRSQHQEQEEDEEEYSDQEDLPPQTKASLSATQRRYKQASGFGKGMASQAARDISQSIQEELMVVDAETRDMLNCDPGRQAVRDFREQMTQRPRNQPVDPMQGWKHPRPLKNLSNPSASGGSVSGSNSASGAQSEGQEDRQMRPRRRQMVMGHTTRNREALTKAPPPLTQFSSGPRFEMHTPNAKDRISEQRSELRPQTSWHRPKAAVEEKPEDLLMDVSLVRAVRPDITVARGLKKSAANAAEPDSWYEQPKAEREFLKQAFLGGGRSRRKAGQPRLDELHYDGTDNSVQISASQQVINQKYAGFRRSARGNQKQVVESVNPTPQLNQRPRAMSEPRDTRRRRGIARQGVDRQAAPRFFGGHRESAAAERLHDEDEDDARDEPSASKPSNWPSPSHSLLKMTSRSDSRLEADSKARGRSVLGEKRGPKKPVATEAPVEHNDIGMPPGYRKESAVQRLGSVSAKHYSRAFNSY